MLSDSKIRSLKPTEKIYRVIDSAGLYIEVRPNGKKFWRFRFQWLKKTLMMGLGEYPVVPLAEARKKRDEAKGLLDKNLNPLDEKRKEKLSLELNIKSTNTFKNIAQEYKQEKLTSRSERHQERFQSALDKDILKVIGGKDVREVTSADVLQIMKNTIKRVKKQRNFGSGEVTAIQNRKFVGAVMRYAIATLRADYDPTYAVKDAIERPDVEHARPIEKHEAKKLREKLETYTGSHTVRNAVLAMLYSMLRTIEIRRMQWSFVDFDEKLITYPVASKKSGQTRTTKKNRIHIVPMSEQLYRLLKEQEKFTGNREYVFASVYKDGMLSATTINRALDYIGLHDVTAHDFRATASTMLHEKGYESEWIELQLSHDDDDKTRASYNHARYLDDRRKMLQDWADIIDSWKE